MSLPCKQLIILLFLAEVSFAQRAAKEDITSPYLSFPKLEAFPEFSEEKIPDPQAILQKAVALRLQNDTEQAEKWLALLAGSYPDPIVHLYYAQALQSNGKYDAARTQFLTYDRLKPTFEDTRGKHMAESIDRRKELVYPKPVSISNLTSLNTHCQEFSPAFFKDGILFISGRDQHYNCAVSPESGVFAEHDPYTRIFLAQKDQTGTLRLMGRLPGLSGTGYHDGPISFVQGTNQFYFTGNRSKIKNKSKRATSLGLCIYEASWMPSEQAEPKPINLHDEGYNSAHPTLSPDGQFLIFSSDRPGGFGGMDLYISSLQGESSWSKPENLGPSVNTAGNEVFPFLSSDGTLFFASDGWGGLGLLDIFFAKHILDNASTPVQNLGAPFNSPKDDFGFILSDDGTSGYFSSARDGGQGRDDLYEFRVDDPLLNSPLSHNPLRVRMLDAVNGQPLIHASLSVLTHQPDGSYTGIRGDSLLVLKPPFTLKDLAILPFTASDPFGPVLSFQSSEWTNNKGFVEFQLPGGYDPYLFTSVPGYLPGLYEVKLSEAENEFTIELVPQKKIRLKGQVFDKSERKPLAHVRMVIRNAQTGESTIVYADSGGSFQSWLEPGADYFIQCYQTGYLSNSAFVSTVAVESGPSARKGIDQDIFLTPVWQREGSTPGVLNPLPQKWQDPAWQETNQVVATEIVIDTDRIYYDFNQSGLRPEAAMELDKLAGFMKRLPAVSLEIRSHTDSRGDDTYNRSLSTQRAERAVQYLTEKGINRSRLKAIGLGEDQLLNDCDDHMDCPEAAHQVNRRTEIRILFNPN